MAAGQYQESIALRVSVIENCQFRCPYCLPGGKGIAAPSSKWLSIEQYRRFAKVLRSFPVRKIRFTGGEPLLRRDLLPIIEAFHQSNPDVALSLTTNGQRLLPLLVQLKAKGITTITIHLDTLREDRYNHLMGAGHPQHILKTIICAKELLPDIKMNVVVQKGKNDDEIIAFLQLSKELSVEVRFIELMNTGSAVSYVQSVFYSGDEILSRVKEKFNFIKVKKRHESDPATLYEIPELGIHFGLIASDTKPFCQTCNRLRLSAFGELRGCLYQPGGISMAEVLSGDGPDERIEEVLRLSIEKKTSFHPTQGKSRRLFSMAEIGG